MLIKPRANRHGEKTSMTSRILVVDDYPSIRTFISMALVNEGYEVHLANDGVEALSFLEDNQPALILLDMRMPDMDGRTFVNKYRKLTQLHSPIVVMTAAHDFEETIRNMHVAGVLQKPFSFDDLLGVVTRFVK